MGAMGGGGAIVEKRHSFISSGYRGKSGLMVAFNPSFYRKLIRMKAAIAKHFCLTF
jgi:hypothetical protein